MAEQHHSRDGCEERQRDSPREVSEPPEPAQKFHGAHRQQENAERLMLDYFMVPSEIGLTETERSNRPRFVITPDQEKEASNEHRQGEEHFEPSERWQPTCLSQFSQTHQHHKKARQMMIEF
jgi:hypothetical protein